ncbi:MAG: PD40 domain-containing protein [Bacteroidaceae bacterium]|nr:PD40 domain-containing protein [Bacteroidaceae bacterium]
MQKTVLYTLLLFVGTWLASCGNRQAKVPAAFTDVADSAAIYPDYAGATIPPNIAPLNFMVTDTTASEFVAVVGGIVCGAAADGKFDIDSAEWHRVLSEARGADVEVSVYAHRPEGWVRHPAFKLYVAREDIDPFVTYRLIEPGYELYQQLGIYQRDLTNFDVRTIYENYRDHRAEGTHCINCHKFQANNAERMYLHVRENDKGTVITDGTEAHKIIIRHDSILASGAYGNWNPRHPVIAYSTNLTAQAFHFNFSEKIEVYDAGSDLLFYDVEHNVVQHILHTPDHFETFPCWSADGTRLFYCDARVPKLDAENFEADVVLHYDSLFYDIWSMPFDTLTYAFGPPRLEVEASAMGLSASEPIASPDGRFLLYSLARCGQFHLYHKDADLWVKDLATGEQHSLGETNSGAGESYTSWASNSRWIAFSTRRDDNDYTRTYIAYVDSAGQGHRAFLLPQRDPEYNLLLLKSFNVPELSRNAIPLSQEQMNHVVRFTDAELATYKGKVAVEAIQNP